MRNSCGIELTVLLVSLSLCALLLTIPSTTETRASSLEEDALAQSYQAFNQVAPIYRAGGQAPGLIDKLNAALSLIEEAHVRLANGDNASAVQLETEAQTILAGVISDIPDAQQAAAHETSTRFALVVGSIPVIVGLTTLLFYVGLRVWRWNEKIRLYEMRIIEKETED